MLRMAGEGISKYVKEAAVGGTELFTMMPCSRCAFK
jgi:uncharacterized protein YcbX